MSTTEKTRHDAIITEEDLAGLDTQSVTDEPLKSTDPINEVFLKVASIGALVLTVTMVVLMTIAVIMRYGFNSSLAIAAEGPTYLLPWLIACGAVVAQAQMAHVGVDYFLEKFKGKAYQVVSIGIWALITVLMAYMAYLGIYMAGPMSQQETPIMGLPALGSFAAFIVMCIALSIQAAVRTYYFAKRGTPRHISPDGIPLTDEDETVEVSNNA